MSGMFRYQQHASGDAKAIAAMLADEFGMSEARRIYDGLDRKQVIAFERDNSRLLAEFIRKTEGQRHAFFRRIMKDHSNSIKVAFLVLAIVGLVRVSRILGLCDRQFLPGGGYRASNSSTYVLTLDIAKCCFDYDWPSEVLDDCGADDDHDDDE